jgi:hypothetical protein
MLVVSSVQFATLVLPTPEDNIPTPGLFGQAEQTVLADLSWKDFAAQKIQVLLPFVGLYLPGAHARHETLKASKPVES